MNILTFFMLFINVFMGISNDFNPIVLKPIVFKPIVLMHGIESHAENLNEMATWLENTFNRKVYNIELGDGNEYSTDTPLNIQIDLFTSSPNKD